MNWPLTIIIATCVQSVLVIQLFVEDTARRFTLDENWLGLLAAAETGSAALLSLLLFIRPGIVGKALLVICGLLLFVGNVISALVTTPEQLLLARILMGGSAGLICAWAYRAVLSSSDCSRTQALGLMLQSLLLVISFGVIPHLVEHVSFALYAVTGVWLLLLLVALFRVRLPVSDAFTPAKPSTPLISGSAVAFFAAVVAMYASHGAFDTFIAELGSQSGIALTDIGYAMMAACAIGIPAAALAAMIGGKWGVLQPVLLAVACMLVSMILLIATEPSVVSFWCVTLFYNFGWVLALPFIVLASGYFDDEGRSASGLLMMQALGMALGAFISGELAAGFGISTTLLLIVPSALIISVGALILATGREDVSFAG